MTDFGNWTGVDLLAHRARTTPDATALVDDDRDATWTYRALDALVEETAAALIDPWETGSDTRPVATLLNTRTEFAALVLAGLRRSVPLATLNTDLDEATLRSQVRQVDPAAVVCEDETRDLAEAVADCPVVSVDEEQVASGESSNAGSSNHGSADPTQLLVFTSGTTGDPKAVRLTAGNLVASAVASAFRLGVDPTDRWLVCLPMYHMGGLAPLVRSTLYGTTTVLQREFDAERTADVIERRDVTAVSLVPTMLARLLNAGWSPPERLRFVLLGGGPADEELLRRCEREGVPVCPTYGATETASQVATARPSTAFEHSGTVGQPLFLTDVTIVDEAGDQCDPGETGEAVVSGPTVTPGYLDSDGSVFGEHGFHTGDLGYRDRDGRLWIEGRADDLIVTGGENVRPATVADALREHPAVADAAVVGVPDEEWGERVAALVVSDGEGSDPAESDLRAFCADRLARYAVPKEIRVVDALPRTASGTVDRERAVELLSG